jgi:SAM-dependent methyltransferase
MILGMTSPPPQRVLWNEIVGPAWAGNADLIDGQLRPFGDRAQAALNLQPGETVFDIGCGTGRTTARLANQVAPTGRAIGIDISAPQLEVARQLARDQGINNVDFVEHELQSGPASPVADAAFSRFGVMFFDQAEVAFANLAASIRPGGRLAFVCWQPMDLNPWMSVSRIAAEGYLPIPPMPTEGPNPFAFADNDFVRHLLEGAGFSAVHFESFETSLRLAGGNDLELVADVMLSISQISFLYQGADDVTKAAVKKAVIDGLTPHLTSDGVRMPAASWVVSAQR